MEAGLILLVIIAFFALLLAAKTVRIIPQARAGVVERLGRYQRTLTPGLAIVVPFVDRVGGLIDLREQVVTFKPAGVITGDNVGIQIDSVLYFTITDAKSVSYEVANPLQAIEQLTVTTLRNVIGGMTLEEALTSRDTINSQLRTVLDEATGRWGIRVNRVEVKAIDPPASIQEAMEKQMRAERDRRAAILTAEGSKQSQILNAEGAKQSAVLTAEGAEDRGHPARRGRGEGDRDGLRGHPRRRPRPGSARPTSTCRCCPSSRRATRTRSSSSRASSARRWATPRARSPERSGRRPRRPPPPPQPRPPFT